MKADELNALAERVEALAGACTKTDDATARPGMGKGWQLVTMAYKPGDPRDLRAFSCSQSKLKHTPSKK